MSRNERNRSLVLGSLVLLMIPVLVARLFTDSWAMALLYGIPIFVATHAFGFWDRRRAARDMERQYGRITVRGPVLSFEDPPGKARSVHAADMKALWYHYSIYGAGTWGGANNWSLVYEFEGKRYSIDIYEGGDRSLLEPLRAWGAAYLPGFDGVTFDRLVWSWPDDDDQPGVLVWSPPDA